MFDNQRYVTKGVIAELPGYLLTMLWYMVETMEVEKDYLQVFELKSETVNGVSMQKIIHSQEQPPYSNEVIFASTAPVANKVYIIDDQTHSTMLLTNEY